MELIVDKSENKNKTDYHLKISSVLYGELKKYAKDEEITVNQLIIRFIEVAFSNTLLLYEATGNQGTRYEFVGYNDNVDVHLWMKVSLYELIKSIHGAWNSYSIAQIVRVAIETCMVLMRQYGSLEYVRKALTVLGRAVVYPKNRQKIEFYINYIRLFLKEFRVTRHLVVIYIYILQLWL